MAHPDFKTALETQIKAILMDYVGQDGPYSDSINYVRKWDNRVIDFDVTTDMPLVAIMARRTTQQTGPGSHEIGTSRELWTWYVDIYYLDIDQYDFDAGYTRQGDIVGRLRNALENETRLRDLSVQVNPTSPTGAYSEYVYNNDWTSVQYDNSGQDGYSVFVSEMQLVVQTARN